MRLGSAPLTFNRMPAAPPPALDSRTRAFDALGGEPYDVVVIGGGINGAAIARDAAMRGVVRQ